MPTAQLLQTPADRPVAGNPVNVQPLKAHENREWCVKLGATSGHYADDAVSRLNARRLRPWTGSISKHERVLPSWLRPFDWLRRRPPPKSWRTQIYVADLRPILPQLNCYLPVGVLHDGMIDHGLTAPRQRLYPSEARVQIASELSEARRPDECPKSSSTKAVEAA